MNGCLRIAWIAVRELLYERVFYILIAFAALSLGLSLLLGQMTYAEQTKLTLDFMQGGTQLSMALFAVFMGVSLFHRELSHGSVALVLSKPVSRTSFLFGKYLGQWIVQTAVIFSMGMITLLVAARIGEKVSLSAILQSMILIAWEVAILEAVTICFAVNAGVITTSISAFTIFLFGHLGGAIERLLGDEGKGFTLSSLKALLPDLEIFNMKAMASYGIAISWAEVAWASVYALCCICFFLSVAAITFSQRDITT